MPLHTPRNPHSTSLHALHSTICCSCAFYGIHAHLFHTHRFASAFLTHTTLSFLIQTIAKSLTVILRTHISRAGLCALCPSSSNVLAVPGIKPGSVHIENYDLKTTQIVTAHNRYEAESINKAIYEINNSINLEQMNS